MGWGCIPLSEPAQSPQYKINCNIIGVMCYLSTNVVMEWTCVM